MSKTLTSMSASELIDEIERLLEVMRTQQQQIHLQQDMFERLGSQVKPQKKSETSLNLVLQQFIYRKAELLQVFDCPELPLYNYVSGSDIREYVVHRKISGITRSKSGRQVRDTLDSLKKTCWQLGLPFWQYFLFRVHGGDRIPPLPDVIRTKVAAQQMAAAT